MPFTPSKFPLLICLTLSLSNACAGCAARETTTPAPMPPEILLQDCPEPTPPDGMEVNDVRTYAIALTRYNIDIRERLSQCNADKRALRQWAARMRGIHGD